MHLSPDGARAADVVVTELSVFRLRSGALVLTELLGDATVEQVRTATGAPSTSTWRIAVQPETTAFARIPDAALTETDPPPSTPTTSARGLARRGTLSFSSPRRSPS